MKKKVLLGLIAALVLVQFIRPAKNNGMAKAETDIASRVLVPDSVMMVLETACYDCHSNKTNYPWYHEVMPIGWWLNDHIEEGKKHLNFSDVSGLSIERLDHKLEETAEEVAEDKMPLKPYQFTHASAKLTEQQRKLIIDWVNNARKELAQKK